MGRGVHDAVDRIEPKAVDVVLARPPQRVLDEEPPHLVGAGPVEVHGLAPRRPVPRREVRPVVREHVPLGPDVVVDHVQDHGEPAAVALVHQASQPLRPSVRGLHRVREHPVVPPVPRARELRDRHELHRRDPEVDQLVEERHDRFELPLGRERPDVKLVQDVLGERRRRPRGVVPLERAGIDHLRRPVHLRLEPGRRVRQLLAVQPEPVRRAGVHVLDHSPPVPAFDRLRLDHAPVQHDLDPIRPRRPHQELGAAVAEIVRPQLRRHAGP